MITPAYAPTATERVLPRLALDFTTGVLDSRVTVTRALNTATRVNSSGLIEGVNADLPRFDYNPATLAPRGLLIEETRTNLISYSSDISNPAWTKVRTTTSGTFTSPDGTSNAYKLQENDTTTNTYFLRRDIASPAGTHTLSFFAKKAERDVVFASLDGASNTKWFDLTNGTTGGSGGGTSTIQAFPNGWYRCTYTFTTTSGTVFNFILLAANTSGISYTGVIGNGAYLWGFDLQAGAFATSYIPTTTTSLTRNADQVTMTGTNFSDWFNSAQGTFDAQFTFAGLSASTGGVPFAMDNGAANGYMIFRNIGGSGLFVYAGSNNVNLLVPSNNTPYNICGSYNSSSSGVAAANGGATSSLTTTGVSTPTQAWIGRNWFGNQFTGWVRKINYWNLLVTPSEVRAFSK